MRAISLTQPWATLVAIGAKRNETRSWAAPSFLLPALGMHERLAIHASKGFPAWARETCDEEPFKRVLSAHGYRSWRDLPTGAILGDAALQWCRRTEAILRDGLSEQEEAFGDYGDDRYGWNFGDSARRLTTPVPCKGALGIWRVPDDIASAVEQAL